MKLATFEYYHGVVLTKLLRKDSQVTLTLVESRPTESWATYVINDDIALTIVHSANPREVSQQPKGTSWTFRIQSPGDAQTQYRRFLALVGVQKDVGSANAIICVLDPAQISQLGLADKAGTITVRKPAKKGQLIVFKDKRQTMLVPQNAIETLALKQ
jgi:hypothetical protein